MRVVVLLDRVRRELHLRREVRDLEGQRPDGPLLLDDRRKLVHHFFRDDHRVDDRRVELLHRQILAHARFEDGGRHALLREQ